MSTLLQHSISDIDSRMKSLRLDEPSPLQAQGVDRAPAVPNYVCSPFEFWSDLDVNSLSQTHSVSQATAQTASLNLKEPSIPLAQGANSTTGVLSMNGSLETLITASALLATPMDTSECWSTGMLEDEERTSRQG